MSMRLASILSEASRNLLSGTTRAVIFALLLGISSGAFMAADALAVDALIARAASFQGSGAATRVLHAEDTISGSACDALAGTGSITVSGALAPAAPIELSAMPTTTIPAFAVTPGTVALLGGHLSGPGAWLSETLARTLGVSPGDELPSTEGTVRIAGTYLYPDDGRDSRLAFAFVLPEPATSTFDECWAAAWPLSDDTDMLLRATSFASGANDPLLIGQLNKTQGATYDAEVEFHRRITRFAYPLIAILGFGLGWTSIRMRRLEHAAALHAGQSRTAQLTSVLIETGLWGAAAAGIALLIALGGLASVSTSPAGADLAPLSFAAVPVIAGSALIGASVGVFTTRERQLFRYFKERS